MEQSGQKRMQISNELLDNMLSGVKTQDDLWGQHGISSFGEIELSTPRDRHSTFEPQIVPKRATRLDNLDNTILSLYAKGMTVRDI